MAAYGMYFWKQTPLFRLLLPFVFGIIFQWYVGITLVTQLFIALFSMLLFFVINFLPQHTIFVLGWLRGIAITIFLFTAGAFITYKNDIRNNDKWVGKLYNNQGAVLTTLQEPLVEKAKSYKALASIDAVFANNKWVRVKGNVLLYFKKDSLPPSLSYGSQIIFVKPLQPITNSGNPGSFNYQRFNAFKDIYHQCFLQGADYKSSGIVNKSDFRQWLFNLQFAVNNALKKYIVAEREQGVAEALLIGYRDDLDKNLVQAYSNTGVVHIIAISGLHLGMIYGTLLLFFKLFKKQRWTLWVKPLVILSVLWIFSLVAGAAPSILRSAVMFTFILAGESLGKKLTIYNTLAASAFTLLILNPFALWDVGFQLSYAAVLSIILFMKPVFGWLYFKNKLLRGIWQLNAVTLSAQILTVPIVCFHFHQFPNLFLISNFIVVPLSSIILFGELIICLFSSIFAPVAAFAGMITEKLLWMMNAFIVRINNLSFAVTDNIQLNIIETILLYGCIIAASFWLMRKNNTARSIAVAFCLCFLVCLSVDLYDNAIKSKLIVYNIPQHTAIDFVDGNMYSFKGDTVLLEDDFLQNFHLKPSRVLNRLTAAPLDDLAAAGPFYFYKNKTLLLIDKPYKFLGKEKIKLDGIVISKSANIKIAQLANAFDCPLYVFDGSNSLWKIRQWKKDCDSLHLRHYSTQENGAFIMNL